MGARRPHRIKRVHGTMQAPENAVQATRARPLAFAFALLLAAIATLPLHAVEMHAVELHAVELHQARASPTDLEVTGLLRGVAAGERRWVRWEDIRRLPSRTIESDGEFLKGRQVLRVVLLEDLLARLPLAPGFDTVVAVCSDGYAAAFDAQFRQAWKPFIVVEINGTGPNAWPLPGMPSDPGPYIVSVSDAVTPGVSGLLDVPHKQPWGTTELHFVREADAFRSLHEGDWRALSASAERGRTLWVNSCFSCHTGPADATGGTRSGRPFVVLQALARHAPDHFAAYVRNPRAFAPEARMTPHAHYTDAQMADIIDFVIAKPAGAAPAPSR